MALHKNPNSLFILSRLRQLARLNNSIEEASIRLHTQVNARAGDCTLASRSWATIGPVLSGKLAVATILLPSSRHPRHTTLAPISQQSQSASDPQYSMQVLLRHSAPVPSFATIATHRSIIRARETSTCGERYCLLLFWDFGGHRQRKYLLKGCSSSVPSTRPHHCYDQHVSERERSMESPCILLRILAIL